MKEEIIVHSQSEFDAIPKDFDGLIVIEKTIGVISVEARGNSSVVAVLATVRPMTKPIISPHCNAVTYSLIARGARDLRK